MRHEEPHRERLRMLSTIRREKDRIEKYRFMGAGATDVRAPPGIHTKNSEGPSLVRGPHPSFLTVTSFTRNTIFR